MCVEKKLARILTLIGVSACLLAAGVSAQAAVNFSVFTDPHPLMSGGTISISYAGDMFVGSVQRDGANVLYSTDLNGGNVQLFAPTAVLAASPASEHFVASSLGLGGFASRDIYVASGTGITHITHDGSTVTPFVTGLAGHVRGILFDPTGSFGFDMLITTNTGHVYRADSLGGVSLLASVGEDTEGLDVAPITFGAYGGQLIVASEGSGLLRAITTTGAVTVLNPNAPVPGAEMLSFVPANLGSSGDPVEGFYAANYTPNVIKADTSEFAGYLGDAIITGEFTHNVHRVHWNPGTSQFEYSVIGQFPNQPEDGIFVTAKHINPTVPEAGSLMLGGMGLIGLLPVLRRHRSK
ncbi:MAG: hypothetical protein M1133_08680 [Armatimonadetes bacterium]|nr:hypothetical protein [Armatimonadota bacterium]